MLFRSCDADIGKLQIGHLHRQLCLSGTAIVRPKAIALRGFLEQFNFLLGLYII